MAITALPLYSGTAPNRAQSQAAFNTNMANWISYTTTFQPLYNTFATQANALAVEVNGYSTDAAAALADTQDVYADTVVALNAAQSAANFKGEWSTLTGALSKPATVSHNGAFWALLNNLANVTTSTPSLTNADWVFVSGTRWQTIQTANFTAGKNGMWPCVVTAQRDATLPAMIAGDFVIIHNDATSTANVRVVNAGYNIRSKSKTATPSDNIILTPGQTLHVKANSATELRIITYV